MQILLRGLRRPPNLERWEARALARGVDEGPQASDNRDLYERQVATETSGPPEAGGAHRRVAAAIMRYEIFPPTLVSGVLRRAPVQPGDTVGILYHAVGCELFFAARVVSCFDQEGEGAARGTWRTGFTYRTLDGHPELGEETFSVEKDLATGAVRAKLQSWSRPGTLLARTFAPVVRKLQIHASHAALDHLQSIAISPAATDS